MLDTKFIRERRMALGLTHAEAGLRAGMTQPAWSRLEMGMRPNPQADTLVKLAKALDCAMEDLVLKPCSTKADNGKSMKKQGK